VVGTVDPVGPVAHIALVGPVDPIGPVNHIGLIGPVGPEILRIWLPQVPLAPKMRKSGFRRGREKKNLSCPIGSVTEGNINCREKLRYAQ